LVEVILKPFEIFGEGIEKTVTKGKKYLLSTEVTGFEGEPYSAFLAVYFLYDKGEERKIRWLNNFSGLPQKITMVFTALSDKIMITYEVNKDSPVHSSCHFNFLPKNKISIIEAPSNLDESFDDPQNVLIKKPPELTPTQEFNLEKNLVWIFGSQRSGTTWLGTKLLSYKNFVLDEPLIGVHLRKQTDGFDIMEQSLKKTEKKDDYFFSNEFKKTWKIFLRKLILNRIFAQFRSTSTPIVIKEPHGSIGAEIIVECFPNSKILFLLRDGRDIIDSLVEGSSKGGWIAKREGKPLAQNERISFLKRESTNWVDLMTILNNLHDSISKDSILVVRYEELLSDTFNILKNIYQFLDIEITDNELKDLIDKNSFENIPSHLKGIGKAVRSASPGKWRTNFSDEEKAVMNSIMGKTLKTLGYNEN